MRRRALRPVVERLESLRMLDASQAAMASVAPVYLIVPIGGTGIDLSSSSPSSSSGDASPFGDALGASTSAANQVTSDLLYLIPQDVGGSTSGSALAAGNLLYSTPQGSTESLIVPTSSTFQSVGDFFTGLVQGAGDAITGAAQVVGNAAQSAGNAVVDAAGTALAVAGGFVEGLGEGASNLATGAVNTAEELANTASDLAYIYTTDPEDLDPTQFSSSLFQAAAQNGLQGQEAANQFDNQLVYGMTTLGVGPLFDSLGNAIATGDSTQFSQDAGGFALTVIVPYVGGEIMAGLRACYELQQNWGAALRSIRKLNAT